MNFKKILSLVLLSSISLTNAQCMEKKVCLTKDIFPELKLCIPSSPYLIKRYNFCHYILREFYKKYSGSYPTEKTSYQAFKDFRSQLIKFLQYSVHFDIDKNSSFSFWTMTLVNSYRCLDENGDKIKINIDKLIKSWNKFVNPSLNKISDDYN